MPPKSCRYTSEKSQETSLFAIRLERQALELPSGPNQVWSMDFVSDALANGRRIKVPTIVDDYSKEAIDLAVDFGIAGHHVTRVLDQAARFRG
ncbi:transposase [Noviherbaspirillum sedimenti]|uniref:Transposase n=1 Tax=Noviherbaspirillum sedimenti TaxID=2320865 RepID=A0A3A3G1N5_9BURK|nr:transposase [Noviherbaspirillum sedimenti]